MSSGERTPSTGAGNEYVGLSIETPKTAVNPVVINRRISPPK